MKHYFYKGSHNIIEEKKISETSDIVKLIKKEFAKVLESRNLSFLIGSGCSMGEGGIPTMNELARKYSQLSDEEIKLLAPEAKKLLLSDECKKILTKLKI